MHSAMPLAECLNELLLLEKDFIGKKSLGLYKLKRGRGHKTKIFSAEETAMLSFFPWYQCGLYLSYAKNQNLSPVFSSWTPEGGSPEQLTVCGGHRLWNQNAGPRHPFPTRTLRMITWLYSMPFFPHPENGDSDGTYIIGTFFRDVAKNTSRS